MSPVDATAEQNKPELYSVNESISDGWRRIIKMVCRQARRNQLVCLEVPNETLAAGERPVGASG